MSSLHKRIVAGIAGVILLVVLVRANVMERAVRRDGEESPVQQSPVAQPAQDTQNTETVVAKGLRIRTETRYTSPGGEDDVAFTVVVTDEGIVTDAMVDVLAHNDTSIKYQKEFGDRFGAALRGKKLSELEKIDTIGGASLTSAAFNNALSTIKAQL